MTADEPITYPRLSLEEVIRKQPEVILISSMERGGRFEKARQDWLKWAAIPAVQKGRIHLIDSDLIDRPSPRLVQGLETMARLVHPEVFVGRVAANDLWRGRGRPASYDEADRAKCG